MPARMLPAPPGTLDYRATPRRSAPISDQFDMLQHVQRTVVDLAFQFGPKVLVAVSFLVSGSYLGKLADQRL